MEIFRDKVIRLKCIERFGMKDCRPCRTPMMTRQVRKRENKNSEENLVRTKASYREAIGSLIYLAGATRPDIAFATNWLSGKQNEPSESDWSEIKRVLRYLKDVT